MTRTFWTRVVLPIAIGVWLGLTITKLLTVGRDVPCDPLVVETCEP